MNLSIDINVSREREWINSNGVIDSNSLKWRGKYIYIIWCEGWIKDNKLGHISYQKLAFSKY